MYFQVLLLRVQAEKSLYLKSFQSCKVLVSGRLQVRDRELWELILRAECHSTSGIGGQVRGRS